MPLFLLLIPLLAAAAAGPAESWRNDVACGAIPALPGSAPRCPQVHCVGARPGIEVCDCADEEKTIVIVKAGGKEVRRWEAIFSLPVQGDSPVVFAADLDGRGLDEVVVATIDAVSMGRAVESWTVCVIAGDAPDAEPACASAEDFGRLGFLTRPSGASACLLLATEWRPGAETGRGAGTYLTGRWLRYGKGEWHTEASRPVVARRLLSSFEKERSEASRPVLWFRDPRARAVTCPDPLCGP